jgi:hypothetical protein
MMSSHVPGLLFGDVVLWEDVLGRSKRLPFEYFQHWEVSDVLHYAAVALKLTLSPDVSQLLKEFICEYPRELRRGEQSVPIV